MAFSDGKATRLMLKLAAIELLKSPQLPLTGMLDRIPRKHENENSVAKRHVGFGSICENKLREAEVQEMLHGERNVGEIDGASGKSRLALIWPGREVDRRPASGVNRRSVSCNGTMRRPRDLWGRRKIAGRDTRIWCGEGEQL